ncbi:MAG: AAA domain-containing protein [Rhodospirillaceae bacterium]
MCGLAQGANLPAEWIRTSIGTVHALQGKEADMVILQLGDNPARPGAFHWAAEKPNLLNVALTRARQRVYVIGNRDLWCRERHFETLGEFIRE